MQENDRQPRPSKTSQQNEPIRPEPIAYPENPRYKRIRFLSVLMDNSIVLPNGYRIGLDPLLGLLPGVGDAIGAAVSSYIVYEAARLGIAKRILMRMLGNVAVEALVGVFPLIGDVFDATWKANMRNLRLLERHYHPAMPERSGRWILCWIAVLMGGILMGSLTFFYLLLRLIVQIFSGAPAV
jgi:hypothetical protein